MMETKAQLRLATTAIIAALAISSTSLLAQDAPPADTSVDALAPAPTTDAAIVPETVAPEVTPTASEAAPAPSSNAKAPRRAATTTTTARPSARPAPAPVGTVDTPAPALAAAGPDQALPADAALPPAPPVIVEPAASRQGQMTAILSIAAAVLLGLAALAAFAIRRRRRRAAEVEDAEWQEEVADAEPAMAVEPEPEPVRTEPTFVATTVPAAAAPAAAFAMGAGPAAASESAVAPTACSEAAPGSHVEAACEGPTADNPSLSIKKRLKRAHFFDQREFLAEAGEVAPMATDAGLPEAVEKPEPAPPTRPM